MTFHSCRAFIFYAQIEGSADTVKATQKFFFLKRPLIGESRDEPQHVLVSMDSRLEVVTDD